jgi:hypothetical protein
MITFKAQEKKLASYITEMGVNFGQGEKGKSFEAFSDFEHATYQADPSIQSSSGVNYANQEEAWRKLAVKYGYDGLKELAATVVKLMGSNVEDFHGMEGLAAASGNKDLLDYCDYGNVGQVDYLITSMFYGGARMKQWKKYVKPYITPQIFIEEMKNADEYSDLQTRYNISNVQVVDNKTIKVFFGSDRNTDSEMTNTNSDDGKKEFHQTLENGDELFDFSIAENFESNVWTIRVQ